jgi:predicted ATPase
LNIKKDEFPLASLPLIGYTITIPTETDNISKDFVFKLQFKSHVYFFRADSQYSFERWLEVIQSAASSSSSNVTSLSTISTKNNKVVFNSSDLND